MPPLKTYTFVHKQFSHIIIEIKEYEEISAKWKLERIVIDINDFELKK
jgi:hypothetical protein